MCCISKIENGSKCTKTRQLGTATNLLECCSRGFNAQPQIWGRKMPRWETDGTDGTLGTMYRMLYRVLKRTRTQFVPHHQHHGISSFLQTDYFGMSRGTNVDYQNSSIFPRLLNCQTPLYIYNVAILKRLPPLLRLCPCQHLMHRRWEPISQLTCVRS